MINTKLFIIVLIFILLDFVTGLFQAFVTKSFKSSCMRQGLVHKCVEVIILLFSAFLEYALPIVGLPVDIPFFSVVAAYITVMEIASICENLLKANPDMKDLISKTFGGIGKHE